MGDVKIKGVFMGQPIDLVICESESVPEAPEDTPEASTPETPVGDADEAPVEADSSDPDAPKNPAGNAEQL